MNRSRFHLTALAMLAPLMLALPSRADSIDIIPRPKLVQVGQGNFTIGSDTKIVTDSSDVATDACEFLTDRLGLASSKNSAAATAPANCIVLTTQGADASLGEEGYALDVTPGGIVIRAPQSGGLFYGAVSLLELMPPARFAPSPPAVQRIEVPVVHIVDRPRFRWRGLMLDVSRHFEPKEAVEMLLDEMAMHKLNVFHWHLTDDQGWRIEIKKYPKLTEIGAWRDSAGFGLDPKLSTTYGPDGKYGGFYTQDDVREVVAYASRRHILVMPEIEMPGHASAARRAYPEYFVPAPPPEPGETKGDAGIFNGIYDPANPRTFVFLQDVLSEVMDLFPSPYIHIGGDEVPKGPWKRNPADVTFMKEQHLSGPDQLQSYFVTRIGKFIASKGKRMVGWDEILEGGLAPDATVMSWRGIEGGRTAAKADHDVIMTPTGFCYLDFTQGIGTEPHETGGFLPVQKVYSYEPVPDGLPPNLVHHLLGVQGNLWTEYVPNFPWAQYMIWPREAAIAEVGWTDAANRNWDDFARRLAVEQQRLDAMHVNYRPIEDDQLVHAIHLGGANGKQLAIDNPLAGTTIHYTLDSSYPSESSPTYTQPIDLSGGWVQVTARYFRPDVVATAAAAGDFLDGRAVRVSSTMPNDWDARQTCFFTPQWGGGEDDNVTVSFDGPPQSLHSILIRSGGGDSPEKTLLKHAVLETSADGKTFMQAAIFGADGIAKADIGGKAIAAFQIRFTAMQMPHPIIRSVEIQ